MEQIDTADAAPPIIAKTLRKTSESVHDCINDVSIDIINDLVILIAPSEIMMRHRFSL